MVTRPAIGLISLVLAIALIISPAGTEAAGEMMPQPEPEGVLSRTAIPVSPVAELAATTREAAEVSVNSAVLNGGVSGMGGASEVRVSFEWGISSKEYMYQTHFQNVKSEGEFSYKLTGLSPDTEYYFRSRVVDIGNKVVACGSEKSFSTKAAPTPEPSPEERESGRNIIQVNNFISNTGIEVNYDNTFINNIQLKTKDERAALLIPGKTRVSDSNGEAPEAFDVNMLILPVGMPSEDTVMVQAYEFGPEGTVFNPRVTLILKYDVRNLPSGAKETDLTIAVRDGARWVPVESRVDTLAGTVSAQISTFGKYALLSPVPVKLSARLKCSGLSVMPSKVEPGEIVTLQLTVSNTGSLRGEAVVVLKINSNTVESREVSLDAGGSETVVFQVQQNEPGDYEVDINGIKDKFKVIEPKETEAVPDIGANSHLMAAPAEDSDPVPIDAEVTIPVIWIIIIALVFLGTVIGLVLGQKKPLE